MKLTISPRAEKQFRKLPKVDQIAIAQKIRSFTSTVVLMEEKLSGFKQVFRVRIGDYRIVYVKKNQEIFIVLIAHRKEIYQLLNQLFG